MSAPFEGSPAFSSFPQREAVPPGVSELDAALSRLNPPRKHYQHYYSTPDANADMCNAVGGMAAFLRAYFFYKSADWPGNKPERLKGLGSGGTWQNAHLLHNES